MSDFGTARDAITGGTWLDDVARASLSAAEAKFSSEEGRLRVSVRIGPYAKRDRFAAWLANQALRLASKRYRAMVKGAIAYGLKAAAMGTGPPAGDTAAEAQGGPQ